MAIDIVLPKLSDTMEEGKLLRWVKQVGDAVAPGDVVAEVETDKADMEVEAVDAGVISEIRVHEGDTAAVGAVLAVLSGDAGSAANRKSREPEAAALTPSGNEKAGAGADERRPVEAKRSNRPAPERERRSTEDDSGSRPAAAEAPTAKEQPPAAKGPARSDQDRKLRVSPLAQRLARERGVDLGRVRGSGAEGKVVARDVDEAPTHAPREERKPTVVAGRIELSKMRQSIARRMTEAKQTVPHFYVRAEIDMGEAARLLNVLREQVDAKITVSHLATKAAAMALAEHPRLNGQWVDGGVEIPSAINLGLVVALEDGLVVPVIHGCEQLTLNEIALEARRLVAAARDGRFSGDDLKGGTFSISNLGMLDVDEFSAIINPPQAAILAISAIKERPVVRQGQLMIGKTMQVVLSCDHRQLNGVDGARFLESFKSILQEPLRMIL